jgi:2,3-bisphosphoglycerate-dependent phosphoglycerate mutase
LWRRSYDVPPPDLEPFGNEQQWGYDARYADLPHDALPRAEALANVLDRMLPWWYDAIVPDLHAGHTVLVAAHGNSLRALVKHLDKMTPEQVLKLNIPTGEPLVYELDGDLAPTQEPGPLDVKGRFLEPDRARAAASAVAKQAG